MLWLQINRLIKDRVVSGALGASQTRYLPERFGRDPVSDRTVHVRRPHFIGPDGGLITLAQLPPRGLKRWLPQHKALVVAAVRHGLITFGEACARYSLSDEEYLSWQRSFDAARPPFATTVANHRD